MSRHRSQCFCHSGPCLHRACHRVQPRRRLDEVTVLRTAGPLRVDESIGVTERETALKHARLSGNFALQPTQHAVEHLDPGAAHIRLRMHCGRQPVRPQNRPESDVDATRRSEEHTSELQSLMRISYAVFCLKKKKTKTYNNSNNTRKHTTMRK